MNKLRERRNIEEFTWWGDNLKSIREWAVEIGHYQIVDGIDRYAALLKTRDTTVTVEAIFGTDEASR